MTPEQLSRLRPYDPNYDDPSPDPFPPPPRDRLSPWLSLLFWSLFALTVGGMLAYFAVPMP